MRTMTMPPPRPLLQRVAEHERQPVPFTLDGQPALALAGDTVLTAILTHGAQLRPNEFSGQPRAGFCLIGACQACWVQTDGGHRLGACTSFIAPGMPWPPDATGGVAT